MRILLTEGQREYSNWVQALRQSPGLSLPCGLLSDNGYSYEVEGVQDPARGSFATKYELAKALLPKIEQLESVPLRYDAWPAVWDSLALLYFESICPRKTNGEWKPNRSEHYVFDVTHDKSANLQYRHRIYGPITLFRKGGEATRPFFLGPASEHGEYEEQAGSNQEIAGNPVALQMLRRLYVGCHSDKVLVGYQNRKRYPRFRDNRKVPVPGSLRRFTTVWQQLKRTYDLSGISCDALQALLPGEFRDWLEK
jgi:hypothetical protein